MLNLIAVIKILVDKKILKYDRCFVDELWLGLVILLSDDPCRIHDIVNAVFEVLCDTYLYSLVKPFNVNSEWLVKPGYSHDGVRDEDHQEDYQNLKVHALLPPSFILAHFWSVDLVQGYFLICLSLKRWSMSVSRAHSAKSSFRVTEWIVQRWESKASENALALTGSIHAQLSRDV